MKTKLILGLIKHQAKKAYGGVDHGTRWRWVAVSHLGRFTHKETVQSTD
jgi:hypothetical protein